MNKIAATLLKDFVRDQKLEDDLEEAVYFEHFAAYLTVGSFLESTLDTSVCVVGEDSQPAIDVLGTVVNGALVTDIEDVEQYSEVNGYLDIDFIFVQAKTSSSFDVSALADLGDFAERIFTDGASSVDNEKISDFADLKDNIYSKAKFFKKRNPNLHLYYVTTGQSPSGDKHFIQKEALIIKRLQKLGLFKEIKIHLIGVSELQKLALQMSNSLIREINFPRKIALPDIPGVTQAFVGVLPAKEFLSLIEGENKNILSSIFYDNVRDWQGFNDVNIGMQQTLMERASRSKFVLMNNGVTIIAKKIQPTGEKIVLEDYQVVNGCQTSNILWQCQSSLDDSVMVPLRVVATDDEAVIQGIIRATNSQTEVSTYQLLAVTDFQKQLELFFGAHGVNSLFYERRSRQFTNRAVEKSRVITPVALVKSFSSMFLEEPHKTTRDFGSVLKKVGVEIFNASHKHEPYFFAALTSFWMDQLLKKGKIDKSVRIARYQVLLALRLIHEPEDMPALNSNKMVRYVNKMLPLFKDAQTAEQSLKKAVDIVSRLMKGKDRDEVRTSGFTQKVHTAANKARLRIRAASNYRG
jgi:hypothetical protein